MAARCEQRERGAVAVEMAIVLPLLLLILGGIIDFGRAYFSQIVLVNAAREGARAGAVGSDLTTIRARATAGSGGISSGDWQQPAVAGVTTAGVVLTTDPPLGCKTAPVPDGIRVTTSARFEYIFLGLVPGITNPRTLRSTAQMGCS